MVDPIRRSVPGAPVRLGTLLLLLAPTTVGGQAMAAAGDLPLKDAVVSEDALGCPPARPARTPTEDERRQAAQLGTTASQALLLGDAERARDLLRLATELDPASADLAYRRGRSLEDGGDVEGAVQAYCRTLSLDANEADAADARARLEALTSAEAPLPEEAVKSFRIALLQVEAGRLDDAAESFRRAGTSAPSWAEAHYNRGVVLERLGQRAAARSALRRYLELEPDAPDAVAVFERIEALEPTTASNLPSPTTALALGLIPGMGQVYTGRPASWLAILGLAGGHAAGGLLHDDRSQPSFQPTGLAIAGAVTTMGALDGYLHARRLRGNAGPPNAGTALGLGLVPGLGQIYAGRTGQGLAFLSMVALTVTASDLLETDESRRFSGAGLGVAAALTLVGAGEAYLGAERLANREIGPPDPYTALALGLIPGMGHFYSGRTALGMTVLTLAAAPVVAGLTYRSGRGSTFREEGLAIGGAVTALGALEAFMWAWRHWDDEWSAPAPSSHVGPSHIQGPALLSAGDGLEMRLLGLRF
jgi:tetratricopeptide (TPR) repeat protein